MRESGAYVYVCVCFVLFLLCAILFQCVSVWTVWVCERERERADRERMSSCGRQNSIRSDWIFFFIHSNSFLFLFFYFFYIFFLLFTFSFFFCALSLSRDSDMKSNPLLRLLMFNNPIDINVPIIFVHLSNIHDGDGGWGCDLVVRWWWWWCISIIGDAHASMLTITVPLFNYVRNDLSLMISRFSQLNLPAWNFFFFLNERLNLFVMSRWPSSRFLNFCSIVNF